MNLSGGSGATGVAMSLSGGPGSAGVGCAQSLLIMPIGDGAHTQGVDGAKIRLG
jgi:hypothetical protein